MKKNAPIVKALSATVSSVFRLLTLLVEAGGQIEVRVLLRVDWAAPLPLNT